MIVDKIIKNSSTTVFFAGQTGYEQYLQSELTNLAGFVPIKEFYTANKKFEFSQLCFARYGLLSPLRIKAGSVNQLAAEILEAFASAIQDLKIESHFSVLFLLPSETVGLSKRVTAVKKQFMNLLATRFGRLAKLISFEEPSKPGNIDGFFVYFTGFDQCVCSDELYFGGQQRMTDDDLAPSRSYLKVEEAYTILGIEPLAGESVVDLGAAPGGWSYSAAKRGALVTAVDNGPMKNGAAGHQHIYHLAGDAFKFQPETGGRYDWLYCDMVEEPHHVMRQVDKWLSNRWCWHYIVNLKFGRVNPVELVREVLSPNSCFSRNSFAFRARHLFHDRNEITVCGTVKN